MPKSKRREAPLPALAVKDWDRSLAVGDFVTLINEVPHIYVVKELITRVVAAHDIYNYHSIAAHGLHEGDEIPPSLVVLRVREAPIYSLLPSGKTYSYKIDAHKVNRITLDDVQFVVNNLLALGRDIQARTPTETQPEDRQEK